MKTSLTALSLPLSLPPSFPPSLPPSLPPSFLLSSLSLSVKFPDHADVVLPANSSYTLRDLFDNMMVEKGKMDSYSVYLEGARAPIELNMSAGNLEGHIVHIKYNPSNSKS